MGPVPLLLGTSIASLTSPSQARARVWLLCRERYAGVVRMVVEGSCQMREPCASGQSWQIASWNGLSNGSNRVSRRSGPCPPGTRTGEDTHVETPGDSDPPFRGGGRRSYRRVDGCSPCCCGVASDAQARVQQRMRARWVGQGMAHAHEELSTSVSNGCGQSRGIRQVTQPARYPLARNPTKKRRRPPALAPGLLWRRRGAASGASRVRLERPLSGRG